MASSHPLAFPLGLEGAAPLRACAGDGFDRTFVAARIAETRALLDAAPALGEGPEPGQITTADGYRIWSATYDEPGQAQDQRSAVPGLTMDTFTSVILNFGTYLAQRPAFGRPPLHTAAHEAEQQDHKDWTFPLVRGANLRL